MGHFVKELLMEYLCLERTNDPNSQKMPLTILEKGIIIWNKSF